MAAAGGHHSVLLRSDGQVIVFGKNSHHQCDAPRLPSGHRYVGVSAGFRHTVLLRDDGKVFKFGYSKATWCEAPGLQAGMKYTQASSGALHSAFLSQDGEVVLSGSNLDGQTAEEVVGTRLSDSDGYCSVLELPSGACFAKVVAGAHHTIALQNDGVAVVVGDNSHGQCNVPELPPGVRYIDAAAGVFHSVLLRDDGQAIAFGDNRDGQLEVPVLELGEYIVDVAAGDYHTVLVRADGKAFAFGRNSFGQSDVPQLPEGLRYGSLVVTVRSTIAVGFKRSTGDLRVICENQDGAILYERQMDPELERDVTIGDMRTFVAEQMGKPRWAIRLFEQSGRYFPFVDDGFLLMSILAL
eukprot:TRINITY_DN62663_c0_g1_i1.p1 TRINITY_DN62663_c0_g1~~TRINITY_DN62663_c0_g1_i1.p1  ORF type:complete len:373 (-),score=65.19 TRINITY_DN62663_c0_g1_i1:294-1355(-)